MSDARGDSGDVTSREICAQGSTEAQGGAVEAWSVSDRPQAVYRCFVSARKELLTSFQGLRVFKRTEREETR